MIRYNTVKLNTDVKVIFNPKSKVREITLLYRPFRALQQDK